jgi:hypothetical protein
VFPALTVTPSPASRDSDDAGPECQSRCRGRGLGLVTRDCTGHIMSPCGRKCSLTPGMPPASASLGACSRRRGLQNIFKLPSPAEPGSLPFQQNLGTRTNLGARIPPHLTALAPTRTSSSVTRIGNTSAVPRLIAAATSTVTQLPLVNNEGGRGVWGPRSTAGSAWSTP